MFLLIGVSWNWKLETSEAVTHRTLPIENRNHLNQLVTIFQLTPGDTKRQKVENNDIWEPTILTWSSHRNDTSSLILFRPLNVIVGNYESY